MELNSDDASFTLILYKGEMCLKCCTHMHLQSEMQESTQSLGLDYSDVSGDLNKWDTHNVRLKGFRPKGNIIGKYHPVI